MLLRFIYNVIGFIYMVTFIYIMDRIWSVLFDIHYKYNRKENMLWVIL